MLRAAGIVGNTGVLINAQMFVDGCPQIVGRKRTVVRVFALGVGGADHLTVRQ